MKVYFIIGFVFSAFFLRAQNITWDGTKESLLIGHQLSVFEDKEKSLSVEQVSSPSFKQKFTPSKDKILDLGLDASAYWINFSVTNKTQEKLLLEVAQSLLPSVDFFYKDSMNKWQVYHAGYKVNLNQKIIKHHYQLFPLVISNADFYLRIQSNGNPVPIRLWNSEVYETKITRQKMIYGIYMGIMIFVILNNLFLFFSLQRFTNLHYAFLVFLYAMFSSLIDGYITYLFPGIDLMFWYFLNPIVNQPNGLLYCILFLEVKKYLPRMYKFSLVVLIYFTSYIIWYNFIPPTVTIVLSQLHALFGILLMATLGIQTGMKGNKLGYYFAAAYFIFFAIATIEVVYERIGQPSYIFETSHVSIAIFIEVFLLAYLLSKRFRWEKAELQKAKDSAQWMMLVKTQENERIVRQQNIILEEKVTERTEQLQEANKELANSLQVVELERQKSEKLLLNILPAATAIELKESGFALPQYYESATVLFTDFKDFTHSSANMPHERLVSELNHCFCEFDRIVQKYGIEKIKTIGDSYMAAGGLPELKNDHAVATVKAGLEMLEFMKQWKASQENSGLTGWEIRIGINTGPVVSGVVGVHKFAYDIWGDTVNAASRMENSGTPGKVNISATTYELVKEHFNCTPRGMITVKGKGELEMYLIESEKLVEQ